MLLTIPFFHVTGCNARLLGSMWNGDTLVLIHHWNVEEALVLIERERVNNAGGVPTIGWQLVDHPALTDCALVPIPHHSLGEEPGAVVHLSDGAPASEAELQGWVRQRLAGFKVPVRIVFCDAPLPRNANGKILKKQLVGLFPASSAA